MSITITDVDELQAMQDDLTEDYVLGNNIDASATETWNINNGLIPIGFYGTPFSGTFDGAGYTISDLWIRRNTVDEIGLFSATDGATIQNVTISDATIWGDDYVGTLVGRSVDTTITDCHASGTVWGWGGRIGGLIGFSLGDTTSECSSSCTVAGITVGVIGSDFIGGLIGWARQSTISQCYATGNVTATDDYAGGLLGVSEGCDIDDCYARGTATGDRYIAGLIGYSAVYGGETETVDNCFSTGAVTGNTDVGGLMGYSTSTVNDCFWDTTTSGQASSAAGTSKTTTQMKVISTFTAGSWDIAGSETNRNDGYPFLAWEIDETDTIWKIYGVGKRSFTMPDILDHKGRPIKNARVEAYRMDNHTLVETEYTDDDGSATFDDLPNDVDVIFTPTWGGPRTPRQPIIQGN